MDEQLYKQTINCCFCDLNLSPHKSTNSLVEGESERNQLLKRSITKYKCPACERYYCSAICSSAHKNKFNCSGIRDKTPYVHLSKFDQKQFLDDYFFLEDVNKKIETSQRILVSLIDEKRKTKKVQSNNKNRRNCRK